MTDQTHWFLESGGRFLQGINRFGLEDIQALFEKYELNQGMDAAVMQISALLAPTPVTKKYFLKRDPYSKPQAIEANFKGAVERGLIVEQKEGKFGPSEKSIKLTGKIFSSLDKKLSEEELVPEEKAHKLFKLLKEVVDAAVENKDIVNKTHLVFGANATLHEGIHPLAKVRRMVIALFGYRDDCHYSAWLAIEDNGVLWDVFTQVWRGEEQNAAKISENNSEYRQYTAAEYQKVLDDLVARGWIRRDGDVYSVTDTGIEIRQGIEDSTDAYFERAFEALDEEETSELQKLLDYAAEKLAPTEEPETD